jgi:hypothetical protein
MRRKLFALLAIPVGAWALDRVADLVASRRGEGTVTKLMRKPHQRRQARKTR